MPKNIASPEQSARARAEIGTDRPGFVGLGNENRIAGVRPLRKADRRLLQAGEPEIYIYNVSPVFQWNANAGGKSYGTILTRKAGGKVSVPLILPGAMVRDYDAGNRMRQTYTEMGIDIAEDILSCSKEMPGLPQNDLTGYGCFFTIGEKFEDLPASEQERILTEANAKHEEKCRMKVLEADQLADNDRTRPWITEVYRLCALFLAEERGDKSMLERRWVSKRGRVTAVSECPFCGFEAKKGLAKCPKCLEILDQELYDSLKTRSAAPKKARSQPSA